MAIHSLIPSGSQTEGRDPIAGDCYGLDQEHLVVKNNNRIRNTWGECDGSILTYEKK